MDAWQGASRHTTDAAESTALMDDATLYADENQQAGAATPGRPGNSNRQQCRRVDTHKADGIGNGGTAGTPYAPAGLQRQKRLQQLYRELQLLDAQASQT